MRSLAGEQVNFPSEEEVSRRQALVTEAYVARQMEELVSSVGWSNFETMVGEKVEQAQRLLEVEPGIRDLWEARGQLKAFRWMLNIKREVRADLDRLHEQITEYEEDNDGS